MAFGISQIVLYSHHGRRRVLKFRIHGLNIITGASKTGKSALIPILDFCLARSDFNVPEGVIRDRVAWYGVLLQRADGRQLFVAKPRPEKVGGQSQSRACVLLRDEESVPEMNELEENSNDDALKDMLTRFAGIAPNLSIPVRGSREPLEANISHAKFYIFQDQGLIANKDVLFFRQNEQFIPQAMRDTLPYLLGAVVEGELVFLNELREKRRQRKILERDLAELHSLQAGGTARATALLAEAVQVGLLAGTPPTNPGAIKQLLGQVANWTPQPVPTDAPERLAEARERLAATRQTLRETSAQLRAAQDFEQNATAFSGELGEHASRVAVVERARDSESEVCPLCGGVPAVATPAVGAIKNRLAELRSRLAKTQKQRPRLTETIAGLDSARGLLRNEVRQQQQALLALESEDARAAEIADQNSRVARIVGRISLYLESAPEGDDVQSLAQAIARLDERIKELEGLIDPESRDDLLVSFLNRIGSDMTAYASKLQFEHVGFPLRLDLRQLTVVADRPGRPFPMQRMGSAENWLDCHVAAALALQKHFVAERRPVPTFLILDQPTQVYFPSSEEYRALRGNAEDMKDSGGDVEAVRRLFNVLLQHCGEVAGVQLIVLEHANLPDAEFQQALVEPVWDGQSRALVPLDWPAN